jgi:DNA-binding NtrC family response regulator
VAGNRQIRKVLMIEEAGNHGNHLNRALPVESFRVTYAGDVEEAEKLLLEKEFDLAVVDADLPRVDYHRCLGMIHRACPLIKVVVVTEFGDEEMWVDALNAGACDLLAKPLHPHDFSRWL